MSKIIKTFGIGQVTEDDMNSTEPYEYNISVYDLFATREEEGIEVGDFPIHLTEKTWLTGSKPHHMQEFNKAFAFAQDYFKANRASSKANASDSHTRTVQQQMMRFTS